MPISAWPAKFTTRNTISRMKAGAGCRLSGWHWKAYSNKNSTPALTCGLSVYLCGNCSPGAWHRIRMWPLSTCWSKLYFVFEKHTHVTLTFNGTQWCHCFSVARKIFIQVHRPFLLFTWVLTEIWCLGSLSFGSRLHISTQRYRISFYITHTATRCDFVNRPRRPTCYYVLSFEKIFACLFGIGNGYRILILLFLTFKSRCLDIALQFYYVYLRFIVWL